MKKEIVINITKILNVILAIMWTFYGVMFVIGKYRPSGMIIGFLLFFMAIDNVLDFFRNKKE